ncbi:MAG: succinylglutamate desuccinylase/aspartoacylase family protein [Prolixibacteraceae bacterium]|nr:succinylglutamate desuccinylase/aspartoacylase family protein [Prolixibacteraceae bacterium]MBN2773828.1 succinylglutamate desuccinylase/aspartoacylase family protein [Prolixibacteraceae bacterium]
MKKNEPLKILGTTVPKGKRTILNLDIARLYTRTKVEIPVIIDRAKTDGPVLLLVAGIHGNETNGVEIVRTLLAEKITRPEKGMVICIPTLNIFGFLNQTREFPDGKDLNRMFPGSKKGSLASIFAFQVMNEILPHIDYCVDFHTGGANRFNSSQIRISGGDDQLLKLAEVFNPRFILEAKQREKSFRQEAEKMGKKVLLFEGGKSIDINSRITKRGVAGVMGIMHYLGMRNYSEELKKYNFTPSATLKSSSWIRAKHGGLFRFTIKDGVKVGKGEIIGSISDPYGNFEHRVKSPDDGYIIGLNHSPVVYRGEALFHLGIV